MTTRVHANVTFSVPEEALREGEETFEEQLAENLEFWFDVPVTASVEVIDANHEEEAESERCATIDLDFTISDERRSDLDDESVEEILSTDLESFFSVPITSTIQRIDDPPNS